MQMNKKIETAVPQTLTSLPEIAIDSILSRLPISDAVRTSALSRHFRRRWLSIPDLDLSTIPNPLTSFQILHLHSAPLRLLKLKSDDPSTSSLIHCWLAALSSRSASSLRHLNLQNFSLHLHTISRYFPNLHLLRLVGGGVRGAHFLDGKCFSGFGSGFGHLRTLHLESVTFIGEISALFTGCPSLEMVELAEIELEGEQSLEIDSKNLRVLTLVNVECLVDFAVKSAPLLEVAELVCSLEDYEGTGGDCNVWEVVGGMPNVKKLEISYSMFVYPRGVDAKIPTRLPDSFDHLKFLSIDCNFAYLPNALLTLCLLRSCPNLEELEYQGYAYSSPDDVVGFGKDFWEAQEQFGVFDKLVTLKISNIVGVTAELDFIQFVLDNARLLKTMAVRFGLFGTDSDTNKFVISELLELQMVSNQAQILFT